MNITERDLVLAFSQARKHLDKIKEEEKEAQKSFDKAESALMEFLESRSAISTAKYEGLGYVQIQKPRLYASYKAENYEKLAGFLVSKDRGDLIKTTVLASSLSGYVAECIKQGVELPDFINYYLKPVVRLYD